MEAAERRLWEPAGADALEYLHGRGLTDETIRAARLGWTPRADGVAWKPPGIVIPWFHGNRLALVKVRPPDAWRAQFPDDRRPPKYLEAFRDPARLVCYPGPEVIRAGLPLVIVEGELDCLLLAQELAELASVVTLGSASSKPTLAILERMLAAAPWFSALDGDDAGDKAATEWPPRARRRRPPGPFKDWTDAHQAGVNLRRWWSELLDGNDQPLLFTWEELRIMRWGTALGDPTPGIVIDHLRHLGDPQP